ncbi:MAG: cupin domain-containing protein, partial [Flavitalea sp.]
TTFGYVQIRSGSVLASHQHMHEQITFIIQGQLEMNIAGETMLLSAGDAHVIPSNTLHSAVAKTDCTVIDVFSPARDDYR